MVRAILEGRKTQTRRICKRSHDQAGDDTAFAVCPALESGWIAWFGLPDPNIAEFTKKAYRSGFPCPYGVPGDRLWVKETFAEFYASSRGGRHEVGLRYRADNAERIIAVDAMRFGGDLNLNGGLKWRPSIHMPRWASRLTLEITDVRVRRLQEISEEDAKAEGCSPWEFNAEQPMTSGELGALNPYRGGFACLWDEINDQRTTWFSNPWTWAITFRRCEV